MAKKKLLIVEAHSDDSFISIAGFLEKNRENFEYHFFLLTCSDIRMSHCDLVTKKQRLAEYDSYVKHFNGIWHRGKSKDLPIDSDAQLDQVSKKLIVSSVEDVIDTVKPDQLIFQGPSFHHDHTIVYEAVIAATRPTSRFCPKEMYIMENPTYVHSLGPHTDFRPDLYINLTEEEMTLKLNYLHTCFPSQIREKGNYLSADGIKSWARYRGIESRCLYAEALKTYKRVI
ncbi:PIG-L family deacetylase [Candidatus Protochlamydia sp. W-9]|uniref:PIG-L family deacetylase n=1 Tax=Candidatus Protochlamydia sp. W-9 TaxID=1785087 RepID=UPI00096A59BC|nr:PIG-L family deacetylase [Candidatus Protochlamydia sp. W-9]